MTTPETLTVPLDTAAVNRAAEALLATLDQERETLAELDRLVQQQIDALRSQNQAVLQEATMATSATTRTVDQLRQARERQLALLRRLLHAPGTATLAEIVTLVPTHTRALATANEAIKHLAFRTRKRGEVLEFALGYAMKMGRDLMQTMQQTQQPRHYTATGGYAQGPAVRSFVNHAG